MRPGLGHSLLTYTAIQQEVACEDLQALPIERPAIRSTISLATLREQSASQLVRMMSDVVREKQRDLVVDGAWSEYVTWLGDSEQSDVPG